MTQYPLISIITAVRNGTPYIARLIESVLQQDYPHFEHIIIDDGSNDDGATVRILEHYPHLKWWSRENRGQYATQNEGIASAKGDFIGIISADDVYVAPHALNLVYESWLSIPKVELIFGKTLHMDQTGQMLPYQLDITRNYPKWLIKYYGFIQHCSLFVQRSFILDNEIYFNASYKYAGDWDWISRLFSKSLYTHYVNQPLSIIRDHPNQTSRNATRQAVESEHRRVCANNQVAYAGHVILSKANQYRAMTLIAAVTLRTKGIGGLVQLGSHWLHRRTARVR